MFHPSASIEFVVLVSAGILLLVVAPIIGLLLYWLRLDEAALLRDINSREYCEEAQETKKG